MVHVGMGESCKRLMLESVRNLVVPVIFDKLLVNKFNKGIFPDERKIVPFNSPPVLILTVH